MSCQIRIGIVRKEGVCESKQHRTSEALERARFLCVCVLEGLLACQAKY